jgi:glutathione S-transferase
MSQSMKLYVTATSPYARLAGIMVIEKGLESRVEIVEAQTRKENSPYYQINYQINPSGRVPCLVTDEGIALEDSQLICAYLDSLDGHPRLHRPSAIARLEASARSLCDSVYSSVALSMRGLGDSSKPASGYTVSEFAADIVAAMDELGIGEATIVGHSMGSLIAARVAMMYPECVTRLVLVGAFATRKCNQFLGSRTARAA